MNKIKIRNTANVVPSYSKELANCLLRKLKEYIREEDAYRFFEGWPFSQPPEHFGVELLKCYSCINLLSVHRSSSDLAVWWHPLHSIGYCSNHVDPITKCYFVDSWTRIKYLSFLGLL